MTEPRSEVDQMVVDLRAALDTDEAAAREAAGESSPIWHPNAGEPDPEGGYRPADGPGFADIGPFDVDLPAGTRHHIARHDPARVLRLVAAHRAILDECERVNDGAELGVGASPEQWLAQTVIRHLASVYAGRDGYDESWNPE